MSLTPRDRLNRAARKKARQRYWSEYDKDEYACPSCGYEGKGKPGEFHVHHRDHDWLNNEMVNLIGLCFWCHKAAHRIGRKHKQLEAWKDSLGEIAGQPETATLSERVGQTEMGEWSA